MTETTTKQEVERGKRKTARLAEIAAVVVLALAILDFKETKDVFPLAFPAFLTYSAALRGLDARFAGRV